MDASLSASHRGERRFVAKVKNVCLAIPFNGNLSFDEFEKEVKQRIARHRKLKNINNLAERISYIKIQTPHFKELIDVCTHILL